MLPLFIVPEIAGEGSLEISGDEARHAISALRVKSGESVSITDGKGKRAEAVILEVSKKSLLVKISEIQKTQPAPVNLVVLQALTKGDRARETIELLTQAGVASILPWAAARSIGQWKSDTKEKWEIWAHEATKQSRRNWIPTVSDLQSTKTAMELVRKFDLALMFHESATNKLSQVLKGKDLKSVLIIIGPEGGLTEDESKAFQECGAIAVVMGDPVFRSAHAGAAALAAVQTGLEIW